MPVRRAADAARLRVDSARGARGRVRAAACRAWQTLRGGSSCRSPGRAWCRRHGADLRPHPRRVRRGADGRRQHPRRDAHARASPSTTACRPSTTAAAARHGGRCCWRCRGRRSRIAYARRVAAARRAWLIAADTASRSAPAGSGRSRSTSRSTARRARCWPWSGRRAAARRPSCAASPASRARSRAYRAAAARPGSTPSRRRRCHRTHARSASSSRTTRCSRTSPRSAT